MDRADQNDKYVVLRRDKLPPGALAVLDRRTDGTFIVVADAIVDDAVVIRRQDLFASPCLATYASMIHMVARNIEAHEPDQARELAGIADYFDDQARLAADEGWKLPDR